MKATDGKLNLDAGILLATNDAAGISWAAIHMTGGDLTTTGGITVGAYHGAVIANVASVVNISVTDARGFSNLWLYLIVHTAALTD